MKRIILLALLLLTCLGMSSAQQRRPVDSQHPMWLIHVDVWNNADPQKIIDLIPDTIKPYVVMNLSLSCSYDTDLNIHKKPLNGMKTFKSWGTICQHNNMWFTCQPASGGHTHIHDNDLETFEYMFKAFPNFLGWNFAEQFWGFNEAGDLFSSSDVDRIALFAKLVEMSHEYGGFLTISFCGNVWSHPLNPIGMMKRNHDLLAACKKYPEAILWLYKYTTSSCFYNNESVTFSPFVAGLAKNYGVRYDNCGWNGALDDILGENHGKKYPNSAGYGTVMEQTCVNGGAVWDGPELIWTEDFKSLSASTVSNYTRRNWTLYNGFRYGWIDMFEKIVDGTMYIPTREEVVGKTKIYVINNVSSGSDEDKYAAWGDLYDGLYKQDDPFNKGNGQWMNNYCYFKKTGRYGAIPVGFTPYDDIAKAIPTKINKSARTSVWPSQAAKVAKFNAAYPTDIEGDLYVNRFKNQLVTYTPYTYLNTKKRASAIVPLHYNTCDTLSLNYGKLSTGIIHEYADHIDLYLTNYREDTTSGQTDTVRILGVVADEAPKATIKKRTNSGSTTIKESYNAEKKIYTLAIKHNGAVDISIPCTGAATERETDVVSTVSLEKPVQPAAYHGRVVVEAEDMDYKNVKACVIDAYNDNWGGYRSVRGHSAMGFQVMGTNTSGALRHTLKKMQIGDYRISVRYTNTAKQGTIKYNVTNSNGSSIKSGTVLLEKTATNEWRDATFEVPFTTSTINLYLFNNNGIACYIDKVTYCPAEIPEEEYGIFIHQQEHGQVVASVDKAAEFTEVTLKTTTDAGYALKGWNIIHGGVTLSVADETSFIMPDDNVVIEPVYEDLSVIYNLDFTNVVSGNFPEGWRSDDGEVHEYPNSYGSGSRTIVGFTGYQGKALYWRTKNCEYGRQSNYQLKLTPGSYTLTYAMAAWKGTPYYYARIYNSTGTLLKGSSKQSATPNVNGSMSGSVKTAVEKTLKFEVSKEGNYVISFENDGTGFSEFLLLECKLIKDLEAQGIADVFADEDEEISIYSVEGIKLQDVKPGMNIVKGQSGSARKVLIK